MNVKGLFDVGVLPDLKIKTKPRKLDVDKLRTDALANVLGQSDKDYFILQNSTNHKPTPVTKNDIEAAKQFFKSTFSVLKEYLKA